MIPLPTQAAVHALLTIRGKTGAVIALQPIKTENTGHIAAAFAECMTVAQRRQVNRMYSSSAAQPAG
eukprot:9251042-Heterocapsa_arctica.AAC.1